MPLSEEQKVRFAFNFTVSNSSTQYIGYRNGDEEVFGLNTSVFPNLKHTVDLENLSEESARSIHRKLVWDKFNLNRIKDVEVAVKIYDLFFIFSIETVTIIVRDSLDEVFTKRQFSFETPTFDIKEVALINDLYEKGRNTRFLDQLISRSLENVSNDVLEKRLERKPTID